MCLGCRCAHSAPDYSIRHTCNQQVQRQVHGQLHVDVWIEHLFRERQESVLAEDGLFIACIRDVDAFVVVIVLSNHGVVHGCRCAYMFIHVNVRAARLMCVRTAGCCLVEWKKCER